MTALCYMVCYRIGESGGTYWDIHYADGAEAATRKASQAGLFENGRVHRLTVPYNRDGMTVEQTAEAYRQELK